MTEPQQTVIDPKESIAGVRLLDLMHRGGFLKMTATDAEEILRIATMCRTSEGWQLRRQRR